jgi:uncharacterized membrane protein HdeD (DUF308 family)
MLQSIARSWWLYALRGVAAIIFGVLAFTSPGATLLALVLVFGIYAIIDGVLAVIASFQMRELVNRWWVVLLEGLIGVIAGIVVLVYPLLSAVTLLYLIAFWAVFTGIMEIIAAIHLRHEVNNEWALILTGSLSVILGIILVVSPSSGALALIWAIGIYAVFSGVLMLFLAFRVHGFFRQMERSR